MYQPILILHSLVRWAVVIVAVVALVRAFIGWRRGLEWTRLDDRLGLFFTISMDIQALLGLILYFVLSPITAAARLNLDAAMADSELRYWGFEHIALMIFALVLAHAGRAAARRAPEAFAKHRQAFIFFGLAVLVVLAAIPWWRPLLRLG